MDMMCVINSKLRTRKFGLFDGLEEQLSRRRGESPMKMSGAGRTQLRHTEKVVLKYYDDGGSGKGHCTYGPGLLVHRGPAQRKS